MSLRSAVVNSWGKIIEEAQLDGAKRRKGANQDSKSQYEGKMLTPYGYHDY